MALAKFSRPLGGNGNGKNQGSDEAAAAAEADAGGDDSCSCHCSSAPPSRPLGPPLFDAAGRLLGRPLTPALAAGALREAAATAGVDEAGEDGSFHTVVTRCPMMRARGKRVALEGGGADGDAGGTGYVCMEWAGVSVVDEDERDGDGDDD